MRGVMIALAVVASACGSTSPTAPSAPPVVALATPPSLATITGHVTATNGGQPLGGLSASLGALTTTTDGSGTFSAQTAPAFSTTLRLTGASIVPRALTLAASTSREVGVTAITLNGSFDLNFYRQLVRNGAEAPATLQPLRRWTRTPQIYLKTVDEGGEVIHGPTLDLIEATVKDAIPRWTSGILGTPSVERGTGTREGVAGWLTIKFPATTVLLDSGSCGRAQIGLEGGWIELGYHGAMANGGTCRTATAVIAPHVVRHEIGHALGFYHTDRPGDLMYRSSWLSPTGLPADRERSHAAIAYARPVGNVDPDSDPTATVNLAPMRAQ